MKQKKIDKILELHKKWGEGDPKGKRAVLINADLRNSVLAKADLENADLANADLINADLRNSDLINADLTNAVLRNSVLTNSVLTNSVLTNAVLTNAVLRNSVLKNAVLQNADLENADLTNADLTNAVLTNADLTNAVLTNAVLTNADLTNAVLTNTVLRNSVLINADLKRTNLFRVDLSGATGLFWLKRKYVNKKLQLKKLGFEVKENYFIAYKSFGENFGLPVNWKIKKGKTIKRHINPDRWDDCSYGINIGTEKWCKEHCTKLVWVVHVSFGCDICIPIYSNGKIRVSECKLIKEIK